MKYINILLELKKAKKGVKMRDKEIARLKEEIEILNFELKIAHKNEKTYRSCYRKKLNELEDLKKELRK